MSIFGGLVAPLQIGALNPLDDKYYYSSYGSYGGQSLAGLMISEDTAMQASAVWGCVRVISESLASVPLILYRRKDGDRRERASDHYLFDILHDQPNEYQTAFEFKEMMCAHCLLTGNAYARLVPGRRGAADQLLPMHPQRMQILASSGRIYYRYQEPNGTSNTYADNEMFHLRGLSNGSGLYSLSGYNTDGRLGMSVIQYARESIGLALATEQYGARLFAQGTQLSGVLTHPGKLSKEAQDRLRDTWERRHSGLQNAHRPAILEEGMKFESIQMSNEDAQFLSTRTFQVEDIARWFRVPLHMIQSTEKATSWGSGLEQLSLAFVMYTLLPWARRWEQAVRRDLITQKSQYYVEYLFDALERADMKARHDAFAVARNWGWLSVNDIRRMENMEPVEDGDVYLQPLNMVPVGQPPAPPEPVSPPRQMGPSEESAAAKRNGHYALLLHEVAARIVRKESAVLGKAARRCCDDRDAWSAEVKDFYSEHAGYVAESLQIGKVKAETYAAAQAALLCEQGPGGIEDLELRGKEMLLILAGGVESGNN
ncbi:MAG: phage portal protein [Sulfuricaulis sp.]|nr:phage portal protein [Sulfuricaulis sp.]